MTGKFCPFTFTFQILPQQEPGQIQTGKINLAPIFLAQPCLLGKCASYVKAPEWDEKQQAHVDKGHGSCRLLRPLEKQIDYPPEP